MVHHHHGSQRFGFFIFVLRWLLGLILIITGLMAFVTLSCKVEMVGTAVVQTCNLELETSQLFIVLAIAQIIAGFLILMPRTAYTGSFVAILLLLGVTVKSLMQSQFGVAGINIAMLIGLCILVRLMTWYDPRYYTL